MNRPRLMLSIFATCLAVVLAAMGWVSMVVIRLDRRDAEAQQQAELQENARLALWRMDSALGPLLAQENGRPFHEYQAFYAPASAVDANHRPLPVGAVLLPSPLAEKTKGFVQLHFQIDPAGKFSSPQLPNRSQTGFDEGSKRAGGETAESDHLGWLASRLDRSALRNIAPSPQAIAGTRSFPPALAQSAASAESPQWLEDLSNSNALRQSQIPLDRRRTGRARNAPEQQELRSDVEYQQRVEANLQTSLLNRFNRSPLSNEQTPGNSTASGKAATAVAEGEMKALWVDGQLLLVRQVRVGSEAWLQGCWFDWNALRSWLLERVSDLLPHADLLPADVTAGSSHSARDSQLLATLPVRLLPGSWNAGNRDLSTPIRTSLVVAWACTLLAVASVVVLVAGLMSLSERRSAFVSAVTHELRTPLTTFRMYTEMLADGRIQDERQRQEYTNTLHVESDRLSRLVENVLSYARLERRRAAAHLDDVTVGQMLDRFCGRFERRAEQSEMQLSVELDPAVREATVRTDVSAVELILFNLVENACKYAATGEDRRIHLGAHMDPKWLRFSLRDHGPGIANDVIRRLFRPFSKSAQSAANSAQGVGLGLALSRRLARRIGGCLRLASSDSAGCRFELSLPWRAK